MCFSWSTHAKNNYEPLRLSPLRLCENKPSAGARYHSAPVAPSIAVFYCFRTTLRKYTSYTGPLLTEGTLLDDSFPRPQWYIEPAVHCNLERVVV